MKQVLIVILFTLTLCAIDKYSLEDGKKLYNQTCVSCHGNKGNSKTNMHLTVKPRRLKHSILNQKQLFLVIKNGSHYYGAKSDIMPSFGSVFTDEEIENITSYIYTKFVINKNSSKYIEEANKIKNTSIQIGKKIFHKNCSLCHTKNYKEMNTFTKLLKKNGKIIYPYNLQKTILTENQIFLYIKYGGKFWGTNKDDMPEMMKKYDDKSLKSVAKYIKYII